VVTSCKQCKHNVKGCELGVFPSEGFDCPHFEEQGDKGRFVEIPEGGIRYE
jgi:hypothetical protein